MFGKHTAKPSITAHERLQLIGLLTLAQRHNKALEDIRAAALFITGEVNDEGQPDDSGHTSDGVYSDYDADVLLGRLDIKVEG